MIIMVLHALQKLTDNRIVRAYLQDKLISSSLQGEFITATLRD